MPITSSELKLYQSSTIATSFTTANIGNGIGTTQINGSTLGEWFSLMLPSNLLGGGNAVEYANCFYKNTDSTIPLTSATVCMTNSLNPVVTHAVANIVSSSTSDNSTYKIRIIGIDNTSTPQQEEVVMNGTTTVNSTTNWNSISRVEFRLVSSGVLTNANGNISVTVTSLLGQIPAGWYSATSEVTLALDTVLNGTSTASNPTTAPGGYSFVTPPQTYATGLVVANAQSLTAGAAQGIWGLLTVAAGLNPSADIQTALSLQGYSA